MIVISKAYQPSSRFCNPITTHRCQRSFNLNSLVETNKKESTAKSLSDEVSDETGVKGNSIDTVRDIPSSPIFERVQRSLARLTEIVPRPVTLAVVAVASSLLLFELSKTLLFLAVPVIAVLGKCRIKHLLTTFSAKYCPTELVTLIVRTFSSSLIIVLPFLPLLYNWFQREIAGSTSATFKRLHTSPIYFYCVLWFLCQSLPGGLQSLKEGLTDAAKGPRVYDTEVVEFASSSSNNDDYSEQNKSAAEWVNDSTSRSLEELEKQSRERSGRSVIMLLNRFFYLESARLQSVGSQSRDIWHYVLVSKVVLRLRVTMRWSVPRRLQCGARRSNNTVTDTGSTCCSSLVVDLLQRYRVLQ